MPPEARSPSCAGARRKSSAGAAPSATRSRPALQEAESRAGERKTIRCRVEAETLLETIQCREEADQAPTPSRLGNFPFRGEPTQRPLERIQSPGEGGPPAPRVKRREKIRFHGEAKPARKGRPPRKIRCRAEPGRLSVEESEPAVQTVAAPRTRPAPAAAEQPDSTRCRAAVEQAALKAEGPRTTLSLAATVRDRPREPSPHRVAAEEEGMARLPGRSRCLAAGESAAAPTQR